jgi:hypothetical protein
MHKRSSPRTPGVVGGVTGARHRGTRNLRTCSKCHERKPISEFRADARRWLRSHCNACSLTATAEWRVRHRDELLARRRARYAELRAAGLSSVDASAKR